MTTIRPSKKTLENLYSDRKMSTRQISKQLCVSKTSIIRWLKFYKIELRDNKTAKLQVKGIILPSNEQLKKDYSTMSLELIAKKYGTSVEAIQTLIKNYKIKKRTRSESRILAFKTNRYASWNKGLTIEDPRIANQIKNLHEKQMQKMSEIKEKVSATKRKIHLECRLNIWNRGLTKENDERVRNIGVINARKKKGTTPWNKNKKGIYSEETLIKMREGGMKAKIKGRTGIERLMRKLLEENGLTEGLEEQYFLKFENGWTIADFAYPKRKIAIYVDGEAWHMGFHLLRKEISSINPSFLEKSKKQLERDKKVHVGLLKEG